MSETSQFTASTLKVLLVDDDEFIHETLKLFLADTQYSVISAMSVKEAMALMETLIPDIVITDAMMPGESGFCLIEKLKSRPDTANVPVILWTILEEMNGGIIDCSHKADISIYKPFYSSDIVSSLERAKQMIFSNNARDEVTIQF
jgi:DNA-binding response OmpR family regulator